MNTADAVRRLMALQKQVRVLREWIRLGRPEMGLQLDDDAASDVLGLVSNLVEELGRHIQNPGGITVYDLQRIRAKMDQAQEILDRAKVGMVGRPPLRKRVDEDEPDSDEDDQEEDDESDVPPARLPSEISWPPKPRKDDDDGLMKSAGQDAYAFIRARLQGRIGDEELHAALGIPIKRKSADNSPR